MCAALFHHSTSHPISAMSAPWMSKKPFYKTFCPICNKSHPYLEVCPVVRERDRQEKKSEYDSNRAAYLKLRQAAEERNVAQPDPPSQRVRRPSDASAALSESSWCSSVSTAATLALSLDEERKARKMERKLLDIARLQERQAQGEVLDKLQAAKIESKAKIDSSVVMLKVRANAVRPSLV